MEIINEQNFKEKTQNGVVLLDFYANWCGPCRMMTPILEEIEGQLKNKVSIYKIDVDEDESLARQFSIMSIPTMFVLVDGQIKEKHIGLRSKNEVLEILKQYIKQ